MVLDSSQEKDMLELRKKRGVVKASLTRMRTFVSKFDADNDPITLLEFRQEELPSINRKFDTIQTQLELLVEEQDAEEEERTKFENDYYCIRSLMQEIINTKKNLNSSINNISISASNSNNRVRLEPIALPTFRGNIQDWESFYDCFRVMVHQDNGLSAAQKFYYLRSSLTGAALDLVKSVPMTDANYEVAINRLRQRYDNPSLVIQSHIRSILETPHIQKPTASELQALHAHICVHIAALKAMNQPTDQWDAWLVTIIVSRLDSTTSHDWQLRQESTDLPKYEVLEKFLASRCAALENSDCSIRIMSEVGNQQNYSKKKEYDQKSKKVALMAVTENKNCPQCKGQHKIYACESFKRLNPMDRLNVVREARLCFNCLSDFHLANVCKSRFSCSRCQRKHNTLLHFDGQPDKTTNKVKNNEKPEDSLLASTSQGNSISMAATLVNSHVFLSTAVVMIKDNYGNAHKCRAVLDSGSQLNFISKGLQNKLKLPSERVVLPVCGIGTSRLQTTSRVNIQILSCVSTFNFNIACHVLPTIVNDLPASRKPKDGWKIRKELSTKLADPLFDQAGSVELLIGAGVFFDIMTPERIPLEVGNISLQGTKLGWIVTGEIRATCLLGIGNSLEENWRTIQHEEVQPFGRASKENLRCTEEQEVVEHFMKTFTRDADGRFVLRLPTNSRVNELGSSLNMATYRFMNVERKLQRDEQLRLEYTKFMTEYIEMGHMEEIKNDVTARPTCYLPHHAVIKSSSLTTKVRIVFDASARDSNGIALNDALMRGPSIQEDLFAILSRFRKHQFVITADIEKMFRQVEVAKEDRDLQRIVWREHPSKVLRKYRLNTVTYGTTPASFMTTKCLDQLARENEVLFPYAAKTIRRDFYMDDIMTGGDSEEECLKLQRDITNILNSAKFPLRKWCSNSITILEKIERFNDDPLFVLNLGDHDTVKSLGLCWKPVADVFKFNLVNNKTEAMITKRALLSSLNSIFDPLGFLAPVLVKGKVFLQQLWQMKINWDSPLPPDIIARWQQFWTDLVELHTLEIPRKVKEMSTREFEIHGFSDASQDAYGACIYVRSKDHLGKWHVNLICAKTRVAPLNGTTIPRLELGGTLVLAQLALKIANSWEIDVSKFWLWTDSTIVLGWLNSHPSRLKTYVSNRICQILEITNTQQWHYIRSGDNPADVLSRGIKPQDLKNTLIWWQGPFWLKKNDDSWRKGSNLWPKQEDLPEQKLLKLALIAMEPVKDLVNFYSTWNRLRRAIAWMQKFVDYLRSKKAKPDNCYLTVEDLRRADYILLKRTQTDSFNSDISALLAGREISCRSKLKSLQPKLKQGLLVMDGRLKNADILQDQREPIILPADHRITRLIFVHIHTELLHCGPQSLLAEVRRRFWPIKGRLIARSIFRRCIQCIKAKPTFATPSMGPLPRQRVQCTRPFTNTGVDFAGPLSIRSGIRGRPSKKAWIAIFVCFSIKAIHIEAVEDMTSAAFLAALRRFISRRGRPTDMWSDNGTNFVGAERELSQYFQNAAIQFANEGITWHFNPPSAPHFGGLWESGVKSAKYHLVRVLKEGSLTYSELETLLCQVEACLNSRPLTPMSSEPSDMEPLTPAHFLIGGPMFLHPEPDLSNENPNRLLKWNAVQGLMQTFWKRWHIEYLPQLQVRGKWTAGCKPLVVNDLVIVKEDNIPPAKWKLARIACVHPGSDGRIRVVTIRLANGNETRRPVVKLCRLPVEREPEDI